jgi:hypothetical protein
MGHLDDERLVPLQAKMERIMLKRLFRQRERKEVRE